MSCRHTTHSSKPRFPATFLQSRRKVIIMMVYIDARLGVCIEHCTVRVVSLILWPVQRSFASTTYVSVRPGTSLFMFTSTPCQSYRPETNPLHFVCVCVCVCVSVWVCGSTQNMIKYWKPSVWKCSWLQSFMLTNYRCTFMHSVNQMQHCNVFRATYDSKKKEKKKKKKKKKI